MPPVRSRRSAPCGVSAGISLRSVSCTEIVYESPAFSLQGLYGKRMIEDIAAMENYSGIDTLPNETNPGPVYVNSWSDTEEYFETWIPGYAAVKKKALKFISISRSPVPPVHPTQSRLRRSLCRRSCTRPRTMPRRSSRPPGSPRTKRPRPAGRAMPWSRSG
jgi:hypothetical protein